MPIQRSGPLLALLLLTLALFPLPISEGAPAREDTSGNDNFEAASEVHYSTNPFSGGLDPSDIVDYYTLLDLIGDTANDQEAAQRLLLSIRKVTGSDISAILYEPNRREIARFQSGGEWSEVEFVVPYDGDYYLRFETDPPGQTSEYEFLMGGEYGYDNSPYSGNNVPGEFTFTYTRELSMALNPLKDIVDYFTIDLLPDWGLEARYECDTDLVMEFLEADFDPLLRTTDRDPVEYRNTGNASKRIHVRVNLLLDGGVDYDVRNRPAGLFVTVWSFTTVPETVGVWPEYFEMDEDPSGPLIINLSEHFREPAGDPLVFDLVSVHSGIDVEIENVTTSYGDPLYAVASLMPAPNWHGEETLTIQCRDRDGSLSDSSIVRVNSVNDLPVVKMIGGAVYSGGTFNMGVPEDEVKVYRVLCSDDDHSNDSLTFSLSPTLPFMSISPANGTITVSPAQADVGRYKTNLTVKDPADGEAVVPIDLTVLAVNDPPLVPTISIIKGNITRVLPGEEIVLEAVSGPDPDGDPLEFTWYWGDGQSSTGTIVSYTYPPGITGNRTIRLVSSDGRSSAETTLSVYIERPEDIAIGDLKRTIGDPSADCLDAREEWRTGEEERSFRLFRTSEPGVDVLAVNTARRVNDLEVTVQVSGSVQIDGEFRYHVFILRGDWTEPVPDVENITNFGDLPDRSPASGVLVKASYLGEQDPNSKGQLLDEDVLVFMFPLSQLNGSGLSYPISRDDLRVFVLVEFVLEERTTGKLSNRALVTDTAGEPAALVPEIEQSVSPGGGSSTIGDLAKGPGLFVLIGLIVIMSIIGIAGFLLVRRENRKRKEEEARFVKEVEQMRAEGRDLFGRVKEDDTKKVSYEELYGQRPPNKEVAPPKNSMLAIPKEPPRRVTGDVSWEE